MIQSQSEETERLQKRGLEALADITAVCAAV
jgi:hypothetical protein